MNVWNLQRNSDSIVLFLDTNEFAFKKPYQCSECGKKFVTSSHLITLNRIYSGEKPYKCSKYGKKCSQHIALSRHKHIDTV